MATNRETSPDNIPMSLTPLHRSVEAHARQAERLGQLRRALLELGEQDVRLHKQTLETLDAMRRDLERMKRTLRALARARAI